MNDYYVCTVYEQRVNMAMAIGDVSGCDENI